MFCTMVENSLVDKSRVSRQVIHKEAQQWSLEVLLHKTFNLKLQRPYQILIDFITPI